MQLYGQFYGHANRRLYNVTGRPISVYIGSITERLIGFYIASIRCLYTSVWTVLRDAN
jgi:hypothetical protein